MRVDQREDRNWSDDIFIGRDDILQALYAMTTALPEDSSLAKAPPPISIHGLPRIGKSLLLTQLKRELERGADYQIIRQTVRTEGYEDTLYYVVEEVIESMFGALAKENYLDRLLKLNALGLMDLLRALLAAATRSGVRTVLLLDEFDLIRSEAENEMAWSEEEYRDFTALLMDRHLDLVCVVASRARVQDLISPYRQRIDPFVSVPVHGFTEADMEEYFETMEGMGCPVPPGEARQELLRLCGRAPHLLSIMGEALLSEGHGEADLEWVKRAYSKSKSKLDTDFRQIAGFMIEEEKQKQRSFTHIVKCYFAPSEDYQDILERFIDMGYIDLLDPDSEHTYQDNPFLFTDINGKYKRKEKERPYRYITLAPLFVDYLYLHHLEEVKDVKDLLSGLVLTLRDITQKELKDKFGDDWNRVVLCDHVLVEHKGKRTAFRRNGEDVEKVTESRYVTLTNDEKSRTLVITSPPEFIEGAFKKEGGSALLDPINLTSHGNILNYFHEEFSPYFDCLGWDLSERRYQEKLIDALKKIKAARDEVAHYTRGKISHEQSVKNTCMKLLKSIYTYKAPKEPQTVADPTEAPIPALAMVKK